MQVSKKPSPVQTEDFYLRAAKDHKLQNPGVWILTHDFGSHISSLIYLSNWKQKGKLLIFLGLKKESLPFKVGFRTKFP